jgi:putative membrane protein
MTTRTLLSCAALALAAACSPSGQETGAAGSGANGSTATADTAMGGAAAHTATYDSATGGAAGTGTASNTALDDSAILAHLSSTDEAEIREAQMAQQKASHAQVKAFAKKLETEHQAHLKKGTTLAQQIGATPNPSTRADAAKDHADMADDLEGKTGAEFDRAFIDNQIDAHEKAIAMLRDQFLPAAKNAQLRTDIQQTIPKMEAHLATARQLKQQL